GMLVALVRPYLAFAQARLDQKVYAVGEGGDRFLADERGKLIAETLRELAARASPGETLAVLPEGVMLNYLARRPNPTRFYGYGPLYVALYGEDAMLAETMASPPDWIVLAHKDN